VLVVKDKLTIDDANAMYYSIITMGTALRTFTVQIHNSTSLL